PRMWLVTPTATLAGNHHSDAGANHASPVAVATATAQQEIQPRVRRSDLAAKATRSSTSTQEPTWNEGFPAIAMRGITSKAASAVNAAMPMSEWVPCRWPPARTTTPRTRSELTGGRLREIVAAWWSASGSNAAPAVTIAPTATWPDGRPPTPTKYGEVRVTQAAAPITACPCPIMRAPLHRATR